MSELTDYVKSLADAIDHRRKWLEEFEIPKLKEDLRIFQTSYSVLYSAFLKKGLVNEDPYKQEVKVREIQAPDTSKFPEGEKMKRLSVRFADFDNQLDFLVNFYQYNVEFFTMDCIKRILSLIKFIDWTHFSPNSASINTHYAVEFTMQVRGGYLDPLSLRLINESVSNLARATGAVIASLKLLTSFNKELYKLNVRTAITVDLPEGQTPAVAQIKKKFPSLLPGVPYYPDLIEEIIKEDYSSGGEELRKAVIKSLIGTEKKDEETSGSETSSKRHLIEGLQTIGAVSHTLADVALKLDENNTLLAHKRLTFGKKIKRFIKRLFKQDNEAVIYDLPYMDHLGNSSVKQVNFNALRADIDKRIKNLSQMSSDKDKTSAKLEVLQEDRLVAFLEKNIRYLQTLHKTLEAMDEYFKTNVDRDDRSRVKGIKPELSTIKAAFIRANQKRCDYIAQKEEAAQFERLGITAPKR
ncbi:MAG: hypothetical protein LBG43_11555 [Treponema sp.]|jgi:hypothetical protein|nr:hypothetical protein [Treponema sp.]